MQGRIIKVSGPLVVAENMQDVKMYDVVKVGGNSLIGEVIELHDDKASIQVYENTNGLKVGDVVENTSTLLSIELGPGIIGGVFDGIGRSLVNIYNACGDRINAGVNVASLDHNRKWRFEPILSIGDSVTAGDVIGFVQETDIVKHKILVPYGVSGVIKKIIEGDFSIDEPIADIEQDKEIYKVCMVSKWPVRIGRPYKSKISTNVPLITGQRIIDTLFPITKGGVAAVPGPFGSGKTVIQHQLAKWSDAEIVVYIGCGERGNEMTDVLNEFPELLDPKTGKCIMQRTVLVANTSDMPVAAREASIYTGITIAEYFRDMGYNVVIMADSTSRWAEALREMSGRLEEMPGEEGYPAYLTSRVASFYERAGNVKLLGTDEKYGSITAIGAVSPQGGDLSEPVSQATLRIVKVFWGLSASLANRRHFPSIDWLISYSGYSNKLVDWYKNNVSLDFVKHKNFIMKILQEEAELNEVLQLVGFDVLGDRDKMTLDIAQIIREDYLQQNAYDEVDTYTSINKQNKMLKIIYDYAMLSYKAVDNGHCYDEIVEISSRKKIGRLKYLTEQEIEKIDDLNNKLQAEFLMLDNEGGEAI